MKKILLTTLSCVVAITMSWAATAPVSVPVDTYATTANSAIKPGGSFKFMTMVKNSLYSYRNSVGNYSDGKGLKTTNNNNSGFVFYISTPMLISASAQLYKDNTGGDITMTIYSITSKIFDQFMAGTDNSTKITDNMMATTATTFTIPIAATAAKGSFSGGMTSGLAAGYYYMVPVGGTSDLYLSSISFASAGPSNDATLSALTVDGSGVAGFAATTLSYEVELPANYSGLPSVAATTKHAKASTTITQATALPGTASVVVTAEDGTTKKTYTITFTKASNAPKVESASWTDITAAGATVDNVGMNITGQVKNGTGLTAITPSFTGKNIQSWLPTTPQDFSKGAVDYTFTSSSGEQTTYHVTITEADPISDDATLKSLTVAGCTLSPTFSPAVTSYQVGVSDATVPETSATANHAAATVQVTPASSVTGVTKILVTAEDGVTTKEYQITYKTVVPSTSLTIHEPEIYEAKTIAGGYGGKLSVFQNREYEVYYAGRNGSDLATIQVGGQVGDRVGGPTKNETANTCEAKDGWFKVEAYGQKGAETTPVDEFTTANGGRLLTLADGNKVQLHVKGFDQFNLFGQDKKVDASTPEKNQTFSVKIDGIAQTMTPDMNTPTVRRFEMSTDEHLIEITGNSCQFAGFSLRVGTDPRTKHIKGNDSTQLVMQTLSLQQVRYYTKYNQETKLEWVGLEATGITLTKGNSDALGDTLILGGTAMCPVGQYTYNIVAYKAGQPASTVSGKFSVGSKITAISDTIQDGYTNEDIDEFVFKYYALSADDVTLTWTSSTPAGITASGENGKYTIKGSPTQAGTYPFTISVKNGNTIQGQLNVRVFDAGQDPILYLYKNNLAYEKDGIYAYLTGKGKNLVPRKAKSELRTAEQYAKYKWCIISEDVDANNPEVMALARGDVKMIVLNMKSFSYSPSRLDWGEPDNGSLNNKDVVVTQPTHPIFQTFGVRFGDKINVLDTVITKGLMPTMVDYQGTLCLATATTRGETYYGDGVQETFLHEVPASLRQGAKYICFPLAISSSTKLSANGKKLLDACITYLLGATPTIALPELKITSFTVNGQAATINQTNNTIRLTMPKGTDLTTLVPTIQLANSTTHVTPASGETIDFTDQYYGVNFVVSDYINIRVYNAIISIERGDGIEEIYEDGEWVTIYDISGRQITTTNENVYRMQLPRGIYLIQTERGSFKIMK